MRRRRAFHLSWPILSFGAFAIGLEASLVGLGPTALIRAGLGAETAADRLSLFFLAFLAGRIVLVFVAHLLPSFAIYTGAVALAALCSSGVIGPQGFFWLIGKQAATRTLAMFARVQRGQVCG